MEDEPGPGDLETLKTLPELENRFREALEDDFNTPPKAITVFRELSRTANVYLETGKNMQVLEEIHALYKRFSDTFGIFAKAGGEEVPDEVIRLVEEREEARNIKDWKTSDAIREKIKSLGYIVQDTKEGGPKIKNLKKAEKEKHQLFIQLYTILFILFTFSGRILLFSHTSLYYPGGGGNA